MTQFWTYTLADGRRCLVDALAGIGRQYDWYTGFGRVVAVLAPLKVRP
jgi:hypothetical protein